MAIKRELIQFTIVNSTDCDYNIPLFQQNVYSINATTKYSWDITTAILSCGTGTLIVNSITEPLIYTPNLAGLLSALNSLGYGFFCTETIGGSTFIYVVDDTNVYGDLDLCQVGTTTTTSTTTGVPTTSTTTTTTTIPSTSTTTSTTTGVPTTSTTTTSTTIPSTSTTTSTTTGIPTTSTTTSTTSAPPTTSTTTSTTSAPPTTSTTTSTTTDIPTTSTTTSTTSAPPTTSTTTSTTTDIPTTSTTTSTTSAPPTTSTTTSTTTAAPLLRTFRVLNNDTVNTITLDVQINSVQEISPTVIPANTAFTLSPQVDCTGFTSELLEYQIVAGFTPSSASFSNGSGTFSGTIAGGFITFTGIDLTPSGTQDLTVNP